MFFYTQNGILGRELEDDSLVGASIWLEHFNLKIGYFNEEKKYTPIEYYVPDLYYWYKYDCIFNEGNLSSINCVHYRKLKVNNDDIFINGRFPPFFEENHPRIIPEIRDYLSTLGKFTIQHLIFLLNMYTVNDKIEMTGLTDDFNVIAQMYLTHLDTTITDSDDCILRLIHRRDFGTLETLPPERIIDFVAKNLELIIEHLPLSLCTKIITAPDVSNKKRYAFRDELTRLGRKNKRGDLCNIMIPSPLRKNTII